MWHFGPVCLLQILSVYQTEEMSTAKLSIVMCFVVFSMCNYSCYGNSLPSLLQKEHESGYDICSPKDGPGLHLRVIYPVKYEQSLLQVPLSLSLCSVK